MSPKLKPLSQQVLVVTGATSGIGLATGRQAAARGAKVVAIARNGDMLNELVEELGRDGGEAIAIACDVADGAALVDAARRAVERFGRIDTWVNNAGVSVYAKLEDTPIDEAKRVFDTNFWGVINGCNAALPHLEQGGALINVGSEASAVPLPLQGIYSASKHAVKAYTDSLRIELMHDRRRISVTLIRPTAIDTPYPAHAANHLDVKPKLPKSLFAPEVVAQAILFAAEHSRRDLYVGGKAKLSTLMAQWMPATSDRMLARAGLAMQRSDERVAGPDAGGLYRSRSSLTVRGEAGDRVHESSAYTCATMHRGTLAVAALGLAALALAMRRRSARAAVRTSGQALRRLPRRFA